MQLGKLRVYLAYTSMSQPITKGGQDRSSCKDLEAGVVAEATSGAASWLAQTSFLDHPGPLT